MLCFGCCDASASDGGVMEAWWRRGGGVAGTVVEWSRWYVVDLFRVALTSRSARVCCVTLGHIGTVLGN